MPETAFYWENPYYLNPASVNFDYTAYINRETQEEKFQFSFFGRTTGEIGILAGLKLISDLKFLCTYDYNLKALQKYSHGSFEVMITYPIHPTKIKKCRYL